MTAVAQLATTAVVRFEITAGLRMTAEFEITAEPAKRQELEPFSE
jgi:hypothetical protein